MAVERTLSIIKPDATRRNLTGKIIAKFEDAGLRVIASRRLRLSQADAEAFYSGPWRDSIRARYGNDPKIQYFETVALTDKASGKAGAI